MTHLDLWLANFPDDMGQYIAMQLLYRFIYYSERDVKRLLEHGLYKVFLYRTSVTWGKDSQFTMKAEKQRELGDQIIGGIMFTPLLDRNKPSESGNVLCRYLNRDLGISSEQICQPQDLSDLQNKHVVILDDFIGSGQQILDFWNLPKINGNRLSDLATTNGLEVTYLCLVATRYGLSRIGARNIHLTVLTCETLEDNHRVFNVPSLYFGPQTQVESAKHYLFHLCRKHRIPLLGFRDLDYAVAFHHAVPDATLPLFWKETANWRPLMKRRRG